MTSRQPDGPSRRDERAPVLDSDRPEDQRDSSVPDEQRPTPDPVGDGQPPVVTGESDEEEGHDER